MVAILEMKILIASSKISEIIYYSSNVYKKNIHSKETLYNFRKNVFWEGHWKQVG